jgi:two-component system, NarL family, nitrate/nitrite response regulator NarL
LDLFRWDMMSFPDPTTLAIIDDHPLYRAGLVSVFDGSSEFKVVAQGETLHDAIAISQTNRPEMMILDINIPGHGLEAARLIGRSYPDVKIVILSVSDRPEHVVTALECGSKGYLQKGATEEDLLDCMRAVRNGKRFIWPELAAKVLSLKGGLPEENITQVVQREMNFTGREMDVAKLLKDGHTNREIASSLQISEKTVKHHMSVIMQKLQVRNRVEATLAILKFTPK